MPKLTATLLLAARLLQVSYGAAFAERRKGTADEMPASLVPERSNKNRKKWTLRCSKSFPEYNWSIAQEAADHQVQPSDPSDGC